MRWLIVISLWWPATGLSFSAPSHELVCAVAYQLLNPNIKEKLDSLLTDKVTRPKKSWEVGCHWPDIARRTTHQATAAYHYMNIPHGEAFDHHRDCAAYDCITQAIARYASAIQPPQSRYHQRQAFFFLAHFITDLHQPFHVGYREDRGGNRIKVSVGERDRKKVTLHYLWDKHIPMKAGVELKGAVDKMVDTIRQQTRAVWKNDNIVLWAKESHCVVKRYGYIQPNGEAIRSGMHISSAYMEKAQKVIYQQLMKASVRLAYLLTQRLTDEQLKPVVLIPLPIEGTCTRLLAE